MTYSCFVIGEGTLLIECTTILSRRGFLIKGIISDDPQVRTYCHTGGLLCIDSAADLAVVLTADPFDCLFSIANGYILPEAILRLPRWHTINYHDSPLPAYAGVNATFWALVNGEKTHGITWHLVNAGIDTGAIVQQNQFPIDPDETSISLNIKCYAAAVDSFQKLIDNLTGHTLTIQPQDLAQRSYYPRYKRPDLLINWSLPAAEITRLHRALDFGFGVNPFGLLKIWTGDHFWLVSDIVATQTISQLRPGTIEAISSDRLLVATSDFSLTIGRIWSPDGEPLSIVAFCEQTGLSDGHVLAHPEPVVSQAIRIISGQCARYQAYWVNQLLTFQPTTLPWAASSEKSKAITPTTERIDVVLTAVAKRAIQPAIMPGNQSHQVLTALLVTLARLTNQPSAGVGYRSHQSAGLSRDTVGLFSDILPLQIEFEWESGFEQACIRVRQAQAELETHLTFARETWITQPALQTRAREFTQHGYPILICLDGQISAGFLPGKSILIGLTGKENPTYQVVFDAGIWSVHWVAELVNRWLIGLEQSVSQPDQPLRSVPLLRGEEQRQILHVWNETAVPYPREQLVCQLVEAQVRQRPQAEALRCGTVGLTYEQLNQQANQLARYLQKQGVTPGTLVGLCLERSPEMIISLLAILKAGGAYVPLDPGYPAARLNQLITQTGVQPIITRKKERDRLPPENVCILVDEEERCFAQQSDQNLDVTISAEAVAYVLFTSGSSGQPKGVAISHRAIGRTVQGANYLRLDETVCMLGLAPLAFDASTLEIWGSLANGGRLVLEAQNLPSLEAIKQTIQTYSVNTAFFTTALFNVLVDSGIGGLVTLTQLAIGGEAASAQHVVRARRQLPACHMINGYGPTESTTFASFYTLSTAGWEMGSVPIGRPISNTQLYIVDSFLNPMPVGVPGEILIGGDGLALGYLHQPDLTAQKFIANPFNHQGGSRLYRTGDLARYLADGTIEFLGRLDDQLKIRGFRIEPVEIEQALCQHPAVGEALVLADTLPSGVKRLVGYVVPTGEAVILPDVLRAFLKTSLPDYLIPNALIALSAIPLTANGKADKAKLLLLASTNGQPGQPDLLTPTEQAMEPLWAAVLQLPRLSRNDHFFDLGGSSLMSMQLISLIAQTFGLRLSMRDVFTHPTLYQLSKYVDQLPRQVDLPLKADTIETDTIGHVRLSFAQNRLWIIEQLQEVEGAYNVPIVLRIEGDLRLPALQESLNEISRRHAILRTRFGHTNGVPFQTIDPPTSGRIPLRIHQMPTNCQPDETVTTWINQEAYALFDLTEGPLWRISGLQLSEKAWMLLLNFHHIVFDGLSTRVLAHELTSLYSAGVQDRPVSLPPLPIQYIDYARWQADESKPESMRRERAYWKKHLAGVPPLLNLPIDRPRPAIQTYGGADYSFTLRDDRWKRLRHGFQEPGTTMFLRLLTVFVVWLHQTAQTDDVVVGIPVSDRNRPGLDTLIGFFVNTLVIRVSLSPDQSFRQLVRSVRQLTLDAYDHQALPFDELIGEVKPPRTLQYAPVVQVLFDFLEDNSGLWQLDDLRVEQQVFQQHRAKFDLNLSMQRTSEGLIGTFNYRTDLFNEQTIASMADRFVQLTDQLLTQPDEAFAYLFSGQARLVIPTTSSKSAPYPEAGQVALPLDHSLIQVLEQIWCELLELPLVNLDDDFFDLGGQSLLAVQVTASILQQLNCSLPVTSIFAHPTLRQLASHIQTTQPEVAWQSLVPIKMAGDGKPLFLVHPITGDVSYVYRLSPYLSEHQSLYGLRALGLDGVTEPLWSIEAIAAYYIELIIQRQPVGPYSIGGFSLGGIIAFEMARQLESRGLEVNLVALIDAYPLNPDADNHTKYPIGQLLGYYYHRWCSLPKEPSLLIPMLIKKVPWVSQYLLQRFWHSVSRKADPAVSKRAEVAIAVPSSRLIRSLREAYSQYQFKPYEGNVVFLRATKVATFGTGQANVDFGWGRYARQGVAVHQLVGQHESLFSHADTVAKIAHILQSYLAP